MSKEAAIGNDEIDFSRLNVAAFTRYVAPTVLFEPFYQEAGLTLDDIVYRNKPQLSDSKCKQLFQLLWPSFSKSMRDGRFVDAEEARQYLSENDRKYFRDHRQHIVFKHAGNTFVAEVETSDGRIAVIACWRVPDSDIYPDSIIVTFNRVADKERFDAIAKGLGYDPRLLLHDLAYDFMLKFEKIGELKLPTDTKIKDTTPETRKKTS